MKRFLIHIGVFFGLPIIAIAALYFITDPYRLFSTFTPYNYDVRVINRDQVSTDFFLYLNAKNNYNSFIFGSSRANGINSYHWRHYLPADARQFLFQGYGQTISGIEEKVLFLEKNGNQIENALILIDIPGSFAEDQYPTNPVMIRDYRTSVQNKYLYHFLRFASFARKPSEWKAALIGLPSIVTIDTFSNEFGFEKRDRDISIQPKMDYLDACSEEVRMSLLKELQKTDTCTPNISEPLINENMVKKLRTIKAFFDRHGTNYRIIITPTIYPLYPSINPYDLKTLEEIFGEENVCDYSGKNHITTDWRYFSDPLHFGECAGWKIIEDIYSEKRPLQNE